MRTPRTRRRRHPAVVALAAGVLIAGGVGSVSLASGKGTGGPTRETLSLTRTLVDFTSVDVGEAGDTQGDYFVISVDVSQDGKKIGVETTICTVVRTGDDPQFQCQDTLSLPGGQLAGQGIFFPNDPGGFRFPITGGTDRYRDVGGFAIGTPESIVLHIDYLSGHRFSE
jgi:hypothetical protein